MYLKTGIPSIKEGFMSAPAIDIIVDREVFKQTGIERGAAYSAKSQHKQELRKVYGAKWRKYLNTPEKSLGKPMRMQF
jgi:hypothetical protein